MMHVVLNFHRKDQHSARLLLELLMSVDEGTEALYHLQYGNVPESLEIADTVTRFMERRNAVFCTDWPEDPVPEAMRRDDPNLEFLSREGGVGRNYAQKQSILWWNLCLHKYIQCLDEPFLIIEPDCVVLKHGWLRDIEDAFRQDGGPVFGHLKEGMVCGKSMPTHWAGCSVYDPVKLRELPLERHFSERYDNPWWQYADHPESTGANNFFYGPVISSYDVSWDYFIFALYWRERTGSNDPMDWPSREHPNRDDLIRCEFKTQRTPENVIRTFADRLPLFHGAKDDRTRELAIRHFRRGTGKRRFADLPVGMPDNAPEQVRGRMTSLPELGGCLAGERIFIIGNGPSLLRTDLTRLRNEYTIGLNRIYLNYENMGFQPTFLCAVNDHVLRQFGPDFDELDSIKLLSAGGRAFVRNGWNTFLLEYGDPLIFYRDISRHVWASGWTVTFNAMQLAFHLGCSEVVLVGVDHNFTHSGPANALEISQGADVNHFHPDYFGKGVAWQYPDLEKSEFCYAMAGRVFESVGRRIVDATIGGKLTIFTKADYDALVGENAEACA
ncbi:hypothetical protein [Pseudodesulfovibrio tunisiensis]|uniref:hypothetical protein n=1 Tax=Pseudodesulfovibrio tunisiensis TaxID=463192 RepID=UPI001FB449FB|nr:hypothetical protein [Pseudodesulfovibrio tunisiensis]